MKNKKSRLGDKNLKHLCYGTLKKRHKTEPPLTLYSPLKITVTITSILILFFLLLFMFNFLCKTYENLPPSL